eukprot:Skav230347  [mRNA]  locus=scaffold25:281615:285943:- [translate_table: standard]
MPGLEVKTSLQLRMVKLHFVKSIIIVVRDYAKLWFRLKSTPRRGKEQSLNTSADVTKAMNDFASAYLADLQYSLDPKIQRILVVYYEDLEAAEGTLPQNLLDFWQLEADEDAQRRIEKMQNISESCDEFDVLCSGPACRNLKAKYHVSLHRQVSAPRGALAAEELPELQRLEERLCQESPAAVNALLLRHGWGSGRLEGCEANGTARFAERRARVVMDVWMGVGRSSLMVGEIM